MLTHVFKIDVMIPTHLATQWKIRWRQVFDVISNALDIYAGPFRFFFHYSNLSQYKVWNSENRWKCDRKFFRTQ